MSDIKIFLHPGMPKTATTWLQNQVFANYQTIACIGRPNHGTESYQKLRHALIKEENPQQWKQDITQSITELADEKTTVLLSDETLYAFELQSVIGQRLKECGFTFEVILTTRNPQSALLSYYYAHGDFLKFVPKPYVGNRVTFNNFFNFYFQSKAHTKLDVFDINRAIEGYSAYATHIHILPFEKLKTDKKAFCARLANILGETETITDENAQDNVTNKGGRRLRYRVLNFLTFGNYLKTSLNTAQRDILKDRYPPYNNAFQTIECGSNQAVSAPEKQAQSS